MSKVYYLLYNINSKIFAFLLLSMDVLYCTGYKGTALSMRMGPPDLWTSGIIMDKGCHTWGKKEMNFYFILFFKVETLGNMAGFHTGERPPLSCLFQTVLWECDPFKMLERVVFAWASTRPQIVCFPKTSRAVLCSHGWLWLVTPLCLEKGTNGPGGFFR